MRSGNDKESILENLEFLIRGRGVKKYLLRNTGADSFMVEEIKNGRSYLYHQFRRKREPFENISNLRPPRLPRYFHEDERLPSTYSNPE